MTTTVFWRPGCGFCARLCRALGSAGVEVERRNIWEDEEAREFVRSVNNGDETVPTVAVGTDVYTNPSPAELLDKLGVERPGFLTRLGRS